MTSFVMIICFTVVTVTIITSIMITNIIKTKTLMYNQQLVDKTEQNIEYYLMDVQELAKNISCDDQVLALINSVTADGKTDGPKVQLDDTLKKYLYLKNYITDISLINEKNQEMYTYVNDNKRSFINETWYKEYFKYSTDEYFSAIHNSIITGVSSKNIDTFTYLKKIYDPADPSHYLCTILIELDARVIRDTTIQTGSQNGWVTFITSNGNNVMYEAKDSTAKFNDNSIEKLKQFENSSSMVKIDGEDYYILKSSNSSFNWKTIRFIKSNILMEDANKMRIMLICVGIAMSILAVIIANFIAKSITNPLTILSKDLKKVENGNLEVEFNTGTTIETKQMTKVLNSMMSNIRALIQKNKDDERLKWKAELMALQAQINPHFLYNTLDSINWMALGKGQTEISDVITNLGKFFRISLSKGNDFIEIRQEIEHAKSYLIIEKFRYPKMIDVVFNISDEILDHYMPKLVLQPIVENSLKHGFEHKGGDGIIRINGRRENETVIFEIIDDGVGIKEDELSRIKNNLVTKFQQKRNSYGLFNVNNRLLLYFGKPYGVEIESVFGEFTCVRLVIPILNEPQN